MGRTTVSNLLRNSLFDYFDSQVNPIWEITERRITPTYVGRTKAEDLLHMLNWIPHHVDSESQASLLH